MATLTIHSPCTACRDGWIDGPLVATCDACDAKVSHTHGAGPTFAAPEGDFCDTCTNRDDCDAGDVRCPACTCEICKGTGDRECDYTGDSVASLKCMTGECDGHDCRECDNGCVFIPITVEVEGDVEHDPGVWRDRNGDGCPETWAVEITSITGPGGKPWELGAAERALAEDALLAEHDDPDRPVAK